mmetsp:Transcript_404/g.629  ORF Transcript_404/g.629 Transcript_404/m.629 type:complete len:706 (+) Transcript_404:471-2588(+)
MSSPPSVVVEIHQQVHAPKEDETNFLEKQRKVTVSFSHVHLYVDSVDDVSEYKKLENCLNKFTAEVLEKSNIPAENVEKEEEQQKSSSSSSPGIKRMEIRKCREMWKSTIYANNNGENGKGFPQEAEKGEDFISQNRDVVRQLLVGFGFRVTGARMNIIREEEEGSSPNDTTTTGNINGCINTRTVLVTSKDPVGVQIVVTALDQGSNLDDGVVDEYCHFNAANLHRFFSQHSNRQGVAVLAFEVTNGSIETIYQRYTLLHPSLLIEGKSGEVQNYNGFKVLEVYAYYKGKKCVTDADRGTVIRFVQQQQNNHCSSTARDQEKYISCKLPGITAVRAVFDDYISTQPAYCDHWVSNVISRTGFLDTLHDTLGFQPKVDFNAGVVAAGEAQIESTVTGNTSNKSFNAGCSGDREKALKDQSQVYLPINNALSPVGHVHGFIQEIGQGVQHIASRVNDLPSFVQRANDYRKVCGEGFTFLNIPRSYYGVLTMEQLINGIQEFNSNIHDCSITISKPCALAIIDACSHTRITSMEGAVNLDLSSHDIISRLDNSMDAVHFEEYEKKKDDVIRVILHSRYANLYSLLGDRLTTQTYIDIVRNQILVDVQGGDLLFQIFTSNMLQRKCGEEAPFFEFIQRVCSKHIAPDGCPAKLKPGCGGFGIRNFLTLFLSIEVSKAMMDAKRHKDDRDKKTLRTRPKNGWCIHRSTK